jgi:hypothetical protein
VLLATGCVANRASSHAYLGEAQSQIVLEAPELVVLMRLEALMARAGLRKLEPLQDRSGQTLHVFQGTRHIRTVTLSSRRGNDVEHILIGSVFYVRLSRQGWGTRVEMLGKPTYNNRGVCSDQDEVWGLDCAPLFSEKSWSGRAKMTGREEALFIRALLSALEAQVRRPSSSAAGRRCCPTLALSVGRAATPSGAPGTHARCDRRATP